MNGITVYVTFNGNCEEAINYYKDVFSGEIVSVMRFKEAPMDFPADHGEKIMHAALQIESGIVMASDGMPGDDSNFGNNFSLNVSVEDVETGKGYFDILAQDGNVLMPYEEVFWGGTFGMIRDKFGIQWMINCEKK